MKLFDCLIVGAGLAGATCAYILKNQGKRCIVIEKRPHVGGNLYCGNENGIITHEYGPHIFHTSNFDVWRFVNTLTPFHEFRYEPMARVGDELYNLPFNMNTFCKLWHIKTPQEALEMINSQRVFVKTPRNLEEQALSLVGNDIYEKFIKGYTEKQWGRDCKELPAFIIKRLPLRFTFNNNYFNDTFQGIPAGGYNMLINKLLEDTIVNTNTDFFEDRERFENVAENIIYTGPLDRYFNYSLGALEYRSLRFEKETLKTPNYQGAAVVNYCDKSVPYTRIIEHKHFDNLTPNSTVITKEYPVEYNQENEPYYPVNDVKNEHLKNTYKELVNELPNVTFIGRLAEYKYYDMAPLIERCFQVLC